MVLVQARRGAATDLAGAVRSAMGLELPNGPRAVTFGTLSVLGMGPEQWLFIDRRRAGQAALLDDVAAAVARHGSVVDQSHGRVVLRISGPRCCEVLSLGVPVDLHPTVFAAGNIAVTRIAHINAILVQVDERPTYDILVGASFAESFWHWLMAAASGCGCDAVKPSD
jgi:sarcosine oxidase subunit gamma